ncbi:MAG: electron transfer flavoprotein subunit alpha/FixB family protein [Desulfobacteraceae bacterium]|nr:electron transfer flavoprotein subunit alpha/FixB family protein [Desulfobacteraceae bacterium]
MKEILVIAEHRQNELRDITFEMLTLADRTAGGNYTISTVLLGGDTTGLDGKLSGMCDRLIVMNDPALADYSADAYLAVLSRLITDRKPSITLIGHTAMGMDLGPALAVRTGIPYASDCIALELDDGQLNVERQIYGGKINTHLKLKPADTYLAGIRPGNVEPMSAGDKSTQLLDVAAPEFSEGQRRQFIEYIEAAMEDVDIAAADILVSVGRGIGKPENIPVAESFAQKIGATLSCSRPVADEGWLPKSRQVGTSGKTVRPKVYIALGISGAYQHQAGMKNAQTIIAVNTDPAAPIFNVAHYGIVGNVMAVLPELEKHF